MVKFIHLPTYKKSFWFTVVIEDLVLNIERKSIYIMGSDLRNIFRGFIINTTRINSLENKYIKEYIEKMSNLIFLV